MVAPSESVGWVSVSVTQPGANVAFELPAQQLHRQLFAYDAYGNMLALPGFTAALNNAITSPGATGLASVLGAWLLRSDLDGNF